MRNENTMTFAEFASKFNDFSDKGQTTEQLYTFPKPDKMCGVDVPDNLNGLTLGQLIELQSMNNDNVLDVIAEVVLGKTKEDLIKEEYPSVFGLLTFVKNEVERINGLFEDNQIPPTSDEIAAGIKDLNLGSFALIDWYAKRMGITDHSVAEQTPWVRVYKCQEIDNKTAMFEKRLRDRLSKKHKK